MFKISKGKFCGEGISFAPPEDYNMVVRRSEFYEDGFKFVSIEGSVIITVCIEREALPAEEQIELLLREKNLIKLTDLHYIRRGRREGVGLYCGRFANSAEAYIELHDFKMNDHMENQIVITVQADCWRLRNTNPIYEVLGIPQVKSFFDSIEFYK